jgi:hypothetical protein
MACFMLNLMAEFRIFFRSFGLTDRAFYIGHRNSSCESTLVIQSGSRLAVSRIFYLHRTEAMTTADILLEKLMEWGVDTVFGFPGDGINGIMEALRRRQEDIRFIQVRHEEAAAFMACAYGKYTGRL